MSNSQGDQKTQEILKVLERFNFKFFGRNENGQILVIAPNGQVTLLDVAYKFLQNQLQASQANAVSGQGPEAMPQMPVSLNQMNPNVEKLPENLDKRVETMPNQERRMEHTPNLVNPNQQQPVQVAKQAPKVAVNAPSVYGDGYSKFKSVDLDLTKPENILKLENFIQKNAKRDNSDSVKWLAFMFQKTIQEIQNTT